jgi:hypothetical protein
MNYTEAKAAIEDNNWFRNRVRVATSKYSNYLLNTPVEDSEYTEKIEAAKKLSTQSNMVIDTLMFTLSGDEEVLNVGPCIDDAQLQMIVEKTIKKYYPIVPNPIQPLFAPMNPVQPKAN